MDTVLKMGIPLKEWMFRYLEEWRTVSQAVVDSGKTMPLVRDVVKKMWGDGFLERRKCRIGRGYEYKVKRKEHESEIPVEDEGMKGLRERLEGVQAKLVGELEKRVERTKELGIEELNALMKTCRENIKALAEMEVVAPTDALKVVTSMDFREEGDGEGTGGGV